MPLNKHNIRFENLEDAEEALRESERDVNKKSQRSAKRTESNIRKKDAPPDENIQKRRFVIAGCILIAVLLIVALAVNVVRKRCEARALAESEAASMEAASIVESIAQSEAEEAKYSAAFSVCEDSEINALVRDYFDARLSADTSRIFEMFGRTDTSENDTFGKKLKAQAAWIQGFNDITVYSAEGLSENEIFCIATYVIDFRRTDAMAPGIMYFFVNKKDDGTYVLEEALIKEKLEYAERLLDTAFARGLIESTNNQLKEALDSNSTLSLIYTSFQNGEIYKESNLDVDADPDVDLFINPEDSILVDADTLKNIEAESAEQASIEASEGEDDVYDTAAADESVVGEADGSGAGEADTAQETVESAS